MMAGFTKARRQKIVEDFARRHNGNFNPALFLDEVRRQGESHPAYGWFEWDAAKAAAAYQLEQARDFARDLRVSFKVEEIIAPNQVRIREHPIPMVISPMDGRKRGGGYVLTDPDDPDHIAEHCLQAARTLQQWRDRYSAALAHAEVKVGEVNMMIARLEHKASSKAA
jgi:hypothetical protein